MKKEDGGIGFRDMNAFNEALLAKQFWMLVKNPESLVAQLLRARYFASGDIFSATLRPKPSFTWSSILGVRDIVVKGTRWLVGHGQSIEVWNGRWIPRPTSFKVITPKPAHLPNCVCVILLTLKMHAGTRVLSKNTSYPLMLR